MPSFSRRSVLAALAGLGASAAAGPAANAAPGPILTRAIPKTGEEIPAIGMGSWITFNVGADPGLRAARAKVLQAFFAKGGGLIDSSPMYGSSEEVIGHGLKRIADTNTLFAATKVWIWGQARGIQQMDNSRRLWGREKFDLMQVHNLLDWEGHLATLRAHKAEGHIRYVGITTSHGAEQLTRAERPVDDDCEAAFGRQRQQAPLHLAIQDVVGKLDEIERLGFHDLGH